MHRRIQTYQIAVKDQSSNVHGRHQTVFKKQKRFGNPNTDCENIQSGHRDGLKKYAMIIIKSGKRHMREGINLPNQEKITIFGEKETYKYLVILETDTIKQVKMKGKKEYIRRTRK